MMHQLHAAHLERLLEENRSLTTKDLHDSGVRTMCISDSLKVDLHKVRIWLEEILWYKKHDMDFHTIQAVREIYEILPARKWKTGKTQTNKNVFIGRSLKEDILLESVKACVSKTC